MTGTGPSEVTRRQIIAAAVGVLGSGCKTTLRAPPPTIQITRIPLADVTGSDKHDIIEGTVAGHHQGQQVVLYTKNGSWWLQPLVQAPFTKIQPNAKWRNATHLGSDYAALLVSSDYRPPQNLKTLPAVGGPVLATSVTTGAKVSPSPLLKFSGYEWRARTAPSTRGGRSNPYSAKNAWTDERGALHLRIRKNGEQFECAEIALTRSLGYGTYSFVVRDFSKVAPRLTLEMFTWDYSGSDQNNREMDVVIRRRRGAPMVTARFVVQPYQVQSNVYEFNLPPGAHQHSFRWEAGQVGFATAGGGSPKQVVAEHDFTVGVPTPGVESARIAFYLPNGSPTDRAEGEVVIDRFEYTP